MRFVLGLLMLTVSSSTFAQTIGPGPTAKYQPLRVFDANGKLLGGTVAEQYQYSDSFVTVTMVYRASPLLKNGDSVSLQLQPYLPQNPARFRWAELLSQTLYFESTDCTGPSFVSVRELLPGRRFGIVDATDNRLYLTDADPVITAVQSQSRRVTGQGCSQTPQTLGAAAVAQPVLDLDDYFTLPFEVR